MVDDRLRQTLQNEREPDRLYTILLQWRSAAPAEIASLVPATARREALGAHYAALKAPVLAALRRCGLEPRELQGGTAILTARAAELRRAIELGVLDDPRLSTRLNEVVAKTQ